MKISLRKTNDSDITKIEQWIKDIEAYKYMSRFYPRAFDRKIEDIGIYLWFVIVVDDLDVGTIWVEKENVDAEVATLGIFIGVKDKFGYGIGEAAIKEVINISKKEWKLKTINLNVRKNNQRAIKCYERCGFFVNGEGTKLNDDGQSIEFIKMKYDYID